MRWISDEWKEYEVLDASNGERLERWGKYILVRRNYVVDSVPYIGYGIICNCRIKYDTISCYIGKLNVVG